MVCELSYATQPGPEEELLSALLGARSREFDDPRDTFADLLREENTITLLKSTAELVLKNIAFIINGFGAINVNVIH